MAHRHAVGAAQPLPVDDRVALGDAERPGHAGAGLLAAGEQRLRLGEQAAAGHLLGEADRAGRRRGAGGRRRCRVPGIRSSSPSVTSASMAWRTVIRATPNWWTSSRSEGAGEPGSASRTRARTYSRTCTCLRAPLSRDAEHVIPARLDRVGASSSDCVARPQLPGRMAHLTTMSRGTRSGHRRSLTRSRWPGARRAGPPAGPGTPPRARRSPPTAARKTRQLRRPAR